MQVVGLSARNIGDGKTVELTWSTPDPLKIRHFIVQRWNRHKRRWEPFDGFHGLVKHQATEIDDNPPQRVLVEVDDVGPSQQTFRVKAVMLDGTETDWATTSTQFITEGLRIGDSRIWYVREGLAVARIDGRTLEVQPGSAVCAGIDRTVPRPLSLVIPDGARNQTFYAWINSEGVIGLSSSVDLSVMKLARVLVDTSGSIAQVEDLRFLWPPGDVKVDWSSMRQRHARLSWSSYREVNLKGWRAYMSLDDGSTWQRIGELEASEEFIEAQIPERYEGVALFRLVALDFGDHESVPGLPVSLDVTKAAGPSVPTGLRASWGGVWSDPYVLLEWGLDSDDNISHYNVYQFLDGRWLFVGSSMHPRTRFIDRRLKGEVVTYAVTAVSVHGLESALSEAVTVQVGITSPPKPPEWAPADAITTGQDPDGTAWIKLRWQHVTERVDGSPIAPVSDTSPAGLAYYRVWLVEDDRRLFAGETPPAENELILRGVTRGAELTYVITAIDAWMNESDPSTPRSIVAGDDRVPKAPVVTRAESVRADWIDWVELEWEAPAEDTKGRLLPADLIREYVILRGLDPINLLEIGRTTSTAFQDTAVLRGQTYYYVVQAVTKTNNFSDPSDPAEILVGDFEAPPSPSWKDLSTTVNEDLTVTNVIEWTWLDEQGNPTDPPSDLRGVYIRASSPPSGWQDVGYVPYSPEDDVREYRHEGVVNGQLYKYALVSVDRSGNLSELSEVRSIVAGSVSRPEAPSVVAWSAFEDGVAKIGIEWSNVEKDEFGDLLSIPVSGWRVYRSTSGMEFTLLAELPKDVLRFVDANLLNGKRYWYRVAAVNAVGTEGLFAEISRLAGDTTPPRKPSVEARVDLDPKTPSLSTVRLSIAPHPDDDDVAGFHIWGSGQGGKFFQIAYSPDGSFEETLPYGSSRTYRVTAVDEAGNEGEAAVVEVEAVDFTVPEAPEEVSLSFEADASMRFQAVLSWRYSPPEDFAAFEIYRQIEDENQLLASISNASATSFTVSGLKGGESYRFGILARDVFGNRSAVVYAEGAPEDATVPGPPDEVVAEGQTFKIFVRWKEPVSNADGSLLEDLKGYRVQGSTDDFETVEFEAFTRADHIFHETGFDEKEWKYRVRTEDLFGNSSSWSVSNTAEARGIEVPNLEAPTPDTPQWADPAFATGVSYSSVDEGKSAWVELYWQPRPDTSVASFAVDMSEDGAAWHQVAQAAGASTSIRISGLLSGVTLWFRLRALGKFQNSSKPTDPIQVTTAQDGSVPEPPDEGYVIEGRGMLVVRWSSVSEKRLSHYEIQYQSKSPVGDWPEEWSALSDVKATYFLHDELDYELVYRYRVRAVTLSGTASPWLVVNPEGNQPRKTGQQDLAAASIVAGLIQVDSIEGYHIKAEAIDGIHVRTGSLSGRHFQAKSISAEHLSIQAGGANWVKNSAFGMRGLEGELGIDWELDGAAIAGKDRVSDIPVGDFCLQLSSDDLEGIAQASQELSDVLAGATVVLSAYAKWSNVIDNGDDTGAFIELLSGNHIVHKVRLIGGSGWTRVVSDPVRLPAGSSSIKVRCRLKETTGDFWITALKVEIGDVATAWTPYPGESYQAGGEVQINSEGIRITGGRLLVETDSGHVKITSDGLFALSGDGERFASLTHQGLVIYDGMFELSAPGGTFVIGPEAGGGYSLKAYKNGSVTVRIGADGDLVVNDGSFQIRTAQSGSRVEMGAFGIRAYDAGGYETFSLSSTGHLSLQGGRFTITTGPGPDASGVVFDGFGIRARNSQGETLRISSEDGSIHIAGAFTIGALSPRPTDSYLQITQNRIYAQDGQGKSFELKSDGTAVFSGGSIVIKSSSSDSTRQVVFDADGLYIGNKHDNPMFLLTQGFSGVDAGLYINDAQIRCGDVFINPGGIQISGERGLVVTTSGPDPETIIEATSSGVKVLGGAGITVEGSGSIGFIPEGASEPITAISASGINAQAVRAGVLTIDGTQANGRPRIEVKSGAEIRAILDASGITIYDGALRVIGPDGKVLIENGKVTANALDIGQAGGSNLVRNGRADFGTEGWTFPSGSVTRATEIAERGGVSAGVSGRYAFRFASLTQGESMSQVISGQQTSSETYTLAAWVYLHSGRIRVEVQNAAEPAQDELTTVGQWTKVVLRFTKGSGSPAVRFVNSAMSGIHTIAYITDVVVAKGVFEPAFTPHASEIFAEDIQGGVSAGYVSISTSGIKVTGGKLDIATAGGQIRLDGTGLSGIDKEGNVIFALNQAGLAMSFPSQKVVVNDQGIKAGSDQKHALLDANGLTIVGGAVNITGSSGRMKISDNLIEMIHPNSQHKVRITPQDGLEVTGGLFKLSSGSGADEQVFIGPYGVRVGPSENQPTISLGISPYYSGSSPDFYGLDIRDGRIRIASEYTPDGAEEPYEIHITKEYIEVRRKTAPQTFSRLTADKLVVGGKNAISHAIAFVESGTVRVATERTLVQFEQPFPSEPHVILAPLTFMTFNKTQNAKNQVLEVKPVDVTPTGFYISARYLYDSTRRPSDNLAPGQSRTLSGRSGSWTDTISANVSRIYLRVRLFAAYPQWTGCTVYVRRRGESSWTKKAERGVRSHWYTFRAREEEFYMELDVGSSSSGWEVRIDHSSTSSGGRTHILELGGYEMSSAGIAHPIDVIWLAIERPMTGVD